MKILKKLIQGRIKLIKIKFAYYLYSILIEKKNLSIKPKIETKPAKLISEVNCKALTDRANAFKTLLHQQRSFLYSIYLLENYRFLKYISP